MSAIEDISRAFEWAGVVVIIAATALTIVRAVATYRTDERSSYGVARQTLGRGLLLGLEVFVAADLINTIAVELTLQSVAALGLLVVVRTILSFSIDVEINGVLPWRRGRSDDKTSNRRA